MTDVALGMSTNVAKTAENKNAYFLSTSNLKHTCKILARLNNRSQRQKKVLSHLEQFVKLQLQKPQKQAKCGQGPFIIYFILKG